MNTSLTATKTIQALQGLHVRVTNIHKQEASAHGKCSPAFSLLFCPSPCVTPHLHVCMDAMLSTEVQHVLRHLAVANDAARKCQVPEGPSSSSSSSR
jgi:hypothetical protein